MRLRTIGIISTLAIGLLAGPLPVEAQQAGKVYRIGFLGSSSPTASAPNIDAFRGGLHELGYIEGKNYILEIRGGRRSNLAAELVTLKPDIIVTGGSFAIRTAKQATSTIPIVMVALGYDPVRRGLVVSLARPGGNITGLTSVHTQLNVKRLELLQEVVPGVKRVAILTAIRRSRPSWRRIERLQATARAFGVKLQIIQARDSTGIENAFLKMTKERAEALVVIPSTRYFQLRQSIVIGAKNSRVPSIFAHSLYVEDGGLISYGANYPSAFRRSATYVDKILKGGNPADIPIERPTKLELMVNLKTAKQIGITIPPSVLYRADKVIK